MNKKDKDLDETLRLEQVILDHELLIRAKEQFHCAGPDRMDMSAESISRTKIDEKEKKRIQSRIGPKGTARILVYFTSTVKPEPLSGAGDMYSFIFHYTKDELIYANISQWRS